MAGVSKIALISYYGMRINVCLSMYVRQTFVKQNAHPVKRTAFVPRWMAIPPAVNNLCYIKRSSNETYSLAPLQELSSAKLSKIFGSLWADIGKQLKLHPSNVNASDGHICDTGDTGNAIINGCFSRIWC